MSNQFSSEKYWVWSFVGKIVVVGTYILILAGFLYAPRFFDWIGSTKKTIHVYAFTEIISPEAIEEFTKNTGISVVVTYFETNEDLYTKFRVTGGEGYDLVTPSDYMVELLAKENLLLELNHNSLPCFNELDPRILNKYFDIGNRHSIPVVWNIYGIAADKKFLKEDNELISLDLIFKGPSYWNSDFVSSENNRICMLEDPLESILFAGFYLFGKSDNFSEEEYDAIKDLLIQQKKWIECYSNSSLYYYLLGKIVPMALTPGIFMRKLSSDFKDFVFRIPEEGSMLVIENFAIPACSKKVDLVYQFINFLLSKEVAAQHSSMYGFNPSNQKAYALIDEEITSNPHYFPPDSLFEKFFIIHNNLSVDRVEEIWLAVKFA